MVRPMVHSIKHYVQYPIDQITTGTLQNILIANAVEQSSSNIATEVQEGASIKAVFFELWLHNQTDLGEFICTISKDMDNGTGPTFVEQASLFTWKNKKNCFYTSQGLTSNDGVSGPINIIRSWVKIPKSKQRFGLGDRLNLDISNVSANNLNRCGFSTFKEYV